MPPAGKDEQSDALRQAARTNNLEKLKSLISKGTDVNTASNSFTPLRWASMYGYKEAAQVLLENGARDDLLSAAARGDLESMEELMSQSGNASSAIDLVNTPNRGGETALIWATNAGHVEAMNLLLKHNAKPDHRDQHGFTALMNASQHGHLGAIRLLVKERADINATEPEDDETPLTMAMHCARSDAVALLLELGAQKPDDFNGNEAEKHGRDRH